MPRERKRSRLVCIPLKDFDRTGAHHHCNRCFWFSNLAVTIIIFALNLDSILCSRCRLSALPTLHTHTNFALSIVEMILLHIMKPYVVAYANSQRISIHLYIRVQCACACVFLCFPFRISMYLAMANGRRAIRIKVSAKMFKQTINGNGKARDEKEKKIAHASRTMALKNEWCVRVITIRLVQMKGKAHYYISSQPSNESVCGCIGVWRRDTSAINFSAVIHTTLIH